jgi:integrase
VYRPSDTDPIKASSITRGRLFRLEQTYLKQRTNLASKGIGVRVLASLAGHRSIAVTQKYIDVNDDMKRNAVELI